MVTVYKEECWENKVNKSRYTGNDIMTQGSDISLSSNREDLTIRQVHMFKHAVAPVMYKERKTIQF